MKTEITLPQAAALLGLPWYTARRLALRGALGPVRQITDRWLLDEAEVLAYAHRAATRQDEEEVSRANLPAVPSAAGSAREKTDTEITRT